MNLTISDVVDETKSSILPDLGKSEFFLSPRHLIATGIMSAAAVAQHQDYIVAIDPHHHAAARSSRDRARSAPRPDPSRHMHCRFHSTTRSCQSELSVAKVSGLRVGQGDVVLIDHYLIRARGDLGANLALFRLGGVDAGDLLDSAREEGADDERQTPSTAPVAVIAPMTSPRPRPCFRSGAAAVASGIAVPSAHPGKAAQYLAAAGIDGLTSISRTVSGFGSWVDPRQRRSRAPPLRMRRTERCMDERKSLPGIGIARWRGSPSVPPTGPLGVRCLGPLG